MKHVVGFSGGIDSQAASLWVRNRFPADQVILLNSDAGQHESPVTVGFIKRYSTEIFPVKSVSAIYADLWKTPGFAERRGFDGKANLSFLEMIKAKGRSPSRTAQFCTEVLKLRPSVRWIKENLNGEEFIRYSGLRRDESDRRVTTPYSEYDDAFNCQIFHPIFDWTKQMCFDYVKSHGEEVNPLYTLGFVRVGCAPCVNSSRSDIRNWAKRFPDIIDRLRTYERESGVTFFSPMAPGIPNGAFNTIDQVIEWANCERGGKQYSLDVYIPAPACESKFGLCG
jgi:3'-phosphoadenosine 5'-phosphosulfate sulfotransferase (PAPS reductase)/FAD synthetase